MRLAAAMLATGLLLSSAGAFDTESASFGPRLVYWIAIAALSVAALEGLHCWLRRRVPAGHEIALRLLGWALLVLPLNMIAVLSCKLLFGGSPSLGGFLLLLPGMSAILAALQFMLASLRSGDPGAASVQMKPDRRAETVADRLPLFMNDASIFALEAQDHYVRVYSSAGQALVRMRLRDAVLLMDEEGLRPHRSWWVARSAVTAFQREEDRSVLVLVDGLRVPVSRAVRGQLGPFFRGSS